MLRSKLLSQMRMKASKCSDRISKGLNQNKTIEGRKNGTPNSIKIMATSNSRRCSLSGNPDRNGNLKWPTTMTGNQRSNNGSLNNKTMFKNNTMITITTTISSSTMDDKTTTKTKTNNSTITITQ